MLTPVVIRKNFDLNISMQFVVIQGMLEREWRVMGCKFGRDMNHKAQKKSPTS